MLENKILNIVNIHKQEYAFANETSLLSCTDIVVGITVAIGVAAGWVEATAIGRMEATMARVSAAIPAVLRTGCTGAECLCGFAGTAVVIGFM